MQVLLPSVESASHRARIASTISSLRTPRIRTWFVNLKAHRVPTLWSLYRGLLRNAPSDPIRWRIKTMFHQDAQLRKPTDVQDALSTYHRWLDMFTQAQQGDDRSQAIMSRYTRMIQARRKKDRIRELVYEEIRWKRRLANRAILTGSYIRPSWYNRPLPQMTPLPVHIAQLIHQRRASRAKRIEEHMDLASLKNDLALERDFELRLEDLARRDDASFCGDFASYHNEWVLPINERLETIDQTFKNDDARLATPYPPKMLQVIRNARREKVANQTRQRQRERRGMITPRLARQMRKGPPAHILAVMSEKEKHMDKVSRGASEGGYVGMVKRELGFMVRNYEAVKAENGSMDDWERLDTMEAEIRAENERRRALSESP